MKTVAASIFLAGLAAAGPLFDKRALVTTEVVETVWTTTTIWVDPTGGPKAQFHEVPVKSSKTLDPNFLKNLPSSSASAPAKKDDPTSTTTTAAAAAPTTTTTDAIVAAAPTTTKPAAPIETPKINPPSSGGRGSKSGDFTFYDPADGGGQVSCGGHYTSNDPIAAIGRGAMGFNSNPNANPNCGRFINIWANGVGPFQARVVDTCGGCPNDNDVDVTSTLFEKFAPLGVGRLKLGASNGMTWDWAA